MTFTLKIDTDNAAFDGNGLRGELARILRDVAEHCEKGGTLSYFQTIFDINGNDVGRMALKE